GRWRSWSVAPLVGLRSSARVGQLPRTRSRARFGCSGCEDRAVGDDVVLPGVLIPRRADDVAPAGVHPDQLLRVVAVHDDPTRAVERPGAGDDARRLVRAAIAHRDGLDEDVIAEDAAGAAEDLVRGLRGLAVGGAPGDAGDEA